MRNGTYAVYKGKEFRANYSGKGNFLLISKDIKDLKYGFSPDPRNKGYYVKTVAKSDLDEVFKIRPRTIYKGDEFQALEVKKNGVEIPDRILLVTPNKDIGDKHGFSMRDFGMYVKEVGLDEIDQLFEIRKPYPNN
jgi:hypothetical protein